MFKRVFYFFFHNFYQKMFFFSSNPGFSFPKLWLDDSQLKNYVEMSSIWYLQHFMFASIFELENKRVKNSQVFHLFPLIDMFFYYYWASQGKDANRIWFVHGFSHFCPAFEHILKTFHCLKRPFHFFSLSNREFRDFQ